MYSNSNSISKITVYAFYSIDIMGIAMSEEELIQIIMEYPDVSFLSFHSVAQAQEYLESAEAVEQAQMVWKTHHLPLSQGEIPSSIVLERNKTEKSELLHIVQLIDEGDNKNGN